MQLVQGVLTDEELIPFHVCIDVMYSETAHLADVILPWTTFLERWDIDSRPPQHLIDYVGLRQPVVQPLGESKDIREIFPELARRIGGGMEQYFPWKTQEEYFEEYFKPIPGGFAHMKKHGVWMDPKKKPNYLPYLRELSPEELAGSRTDPTTGIISRGEEAIGISIDGVARRGFNTPSRKIEVVSKFVEEKGKAVNREIDPLPIYAPIPDHARGLAADQLIMISFKWNVHNAHRTMQSKWLREINHSNPAWINSETAERFGLSEGDWIEITSYRPKDSQVPNDDGSVVGTLKTRVHLTEGIHPTVLAVSHNNGRWVGGAFASSETNTSFPERPASDPDAGRVWWKEEVSVAQNNLIPIYPDPRTGQQSWHDTVVRIRKV
jgi:anaerobic selenocysteine-containing dehydrogenase